jgi:RES domain-containing protein
VQVFRLQRKRYGTALSGIGSAQLGGRWNNPGTEMVYTSGNRSLAMAEVLVHLSISEMPNDFRMLTIDIPKALTLEELHLKDLHPDWNRFPHIPQTQLQGDAFIQGNRVAVLQVPSVITPGDFNFLLNPQHSDFAKIQVVCDEPFPFDDRLFLPPAHLSPTR